MVKSKALPSITEWQTLSSVMGWLDWIVDDSERPQSPFTGGLLGYGSAVTPSSDVPSKLKDWQISDSYDPVTEILRALPGIESIGHSRSERIGVLHARLRELPAFDWLMRQDAFVRACNTVHRTHKPSSSSHDRQWLDLRLVRAVHRPVASLHLLKTANYQPEYPDVRKLESAVTKAKQMHTFFKMNGGLFLGEHGLPWEVGQAAELIHLRLAEYAAKNRKPKSDAPILEIQFMNEVKSALRQEFGKPMATVLGQLCEMVGYSPGGFARKVSRIVSERKPSGS